MGVPAAWAAKTASARVLSSGLSGSIVSAKRAIGGRVLVTRADYRIVGKGRKPAEAFPHHLMGALEDPAAAERHEAVGREHRGFRW